MNGVERTELDALRVEMKEGFARLEGRIDAFQQSHSNQHGTEQSAYQQHVIESALATQRLNSLEGLPRRVDELEDWRIEVRTLGMFVRLTFGSSVVGALLGVIALAKALGVF